jgi:hypothetical protein
MNVFSLFSFLSPKYALSTLLTLSKLLIGLGTRFLSQPRFQKSCHNVDIGGGFDWRGLVKFGVYFRFRSDTHVDYRRRRRIFRK